MSASEMKTITAVIRVREGAEAQMRGALLKVAGNAAADEPDAPDFFVSVSVLDPRLFTTCERVRDRGAMAADNISPTPAASFLTAKPLRDGEGAAAIADRPRAQEKPMEAGRLRATHAAPAGSQGDEAPSPSRRRTS